MLFQNDMSLIYSIFAILILANIAMLVIERFLIPLFTKILEVPDRIVMVIVIMMCYLGTYNSQRSVTDLILFAVSAWWAICWRCATSSWRRSSWALSSGPSPSGICGRR
jgi:putative tricarboxylic transport membrane protein